MTVWLCIFIPVIVTILLFLFFRKKIMVWEVLLLVVPSVLIILAMDLIMISSNESDTEYFGKYITKVIYYQAWNEEVPCRHPIYCTRSYPCGTSKSPRTCTQQYVCGHVHAYDVDYHPEHWTKTDNNGDQHGISKSEFDILQVRFATKPYFVDMQRHYHSIDGDAYHTEWNKKPETVDAITIEHSYKNKVKASHSIFKFEDIDDKTKKMWDLLDYPKVDGLYQSCVLGKTVDPTTNRKLQYINGYYGSSNQFRMYILFFQDKSMEVAFKQRSFWEGGNKNEMTICIGTDKLGNYQWCKAFSWMDKPELEVRVESWFNDASNKNDLSKFADWMPKQIEQHWHRKNFKDFEYLNVEVTSGQMIWILIIVALYNVGMSIWVVINEFKSE